MSKTTLEVIFEVRNRQGPQGSYENITSRLLMRSSRGLIIPRNVPVLDSNKKYDSDDGVHYSKTVKDNSANLAKRLCQERNNAESRPVTPQEKASLQEYSEESKGLNNYLIRNKGDATRMTGIYNLVHSNLSKFLDARPATHHNVTYSGLRFDPDKIMATGQTGRLMTSPAYMSTTSNPQKAMAFTTGDHFNIDGIHHVGVFHIRPGDKATPIRDLVIPIFEDEDETLIKHGQILHKIGQHDVRSHFFEHGSSVAMNNPYSHSPAIDPEKKARIRLHHFRLYDPEKSITETKVETLHGIPIIPVPIHFKHNAPSGVHNMPIPSIPQPIHFNPDRRRKS